MKKTKQMSFWTSKFGKEYTDRNSLTDVHSWNEYYKKLYGVSRFDMFKTFLDGIDLESRILEVGCNKGHQLLALQELGYKNLNGIELQSYAIKQAKNIAKDIIIIKGSVFEIPFEDAHFELVMTNGLLIIIAPEDLPNALSEIVRSTNKYILGFEYFSEETKEVNYRGINGLLWKMNYKQLYLEMFPNLRLVKEVHYPYIVKEETGNIDSMFLLEKF